MYWYKKGLYFHCQKCSKCCTGCPGYVWINLEDIKNISKFLKITKNTFSKKYTRFIHGKLSLKENQINFDCIFLKNKKCLIYEVRPKQCQTFPFWKENLKSFSSWQNLKEFCPGIEGREKKLFTFEKIQKKMNLF